MKVLAFVLLLAVAYAKNEKYQGWKSYYVRPSDQGQLVYLRSMAEKYDLNFLSNANVGRDGVVLVKSSFDEQFVKELAAERFSYRIHSEDVKAQLDADDLLVRTRKAKDEETEEPVSIFDNYQEIEEINKYLEGIAEEYPDLVTLANGTSFEGRPVYYLKISKTNFEDDSKPVIYIDAGIHAREWIAPPVVLYAINQLLNEPESDLMNNFNWVLLPVVNPDGYKYTFTSNRLWSKTRSTDQHLLSALCPGVDINRNFDFYWNLFGTSNSPCVGSYPGSAPYSEKETQVVKDIFDEYRTRIILYISLHSYGSMILYPWGHDGSLSNYAFALHTVAVAMADAIDDNALPGFPKYVVGNSVLVTEQQTSGTSVDYAHFQGIPLSFNVELPGFSNNTRGFDMDPKYIKQVASETWAGISVAARRAGELFGDFKH